MARERDALRQKRRGGERKGVALVMAFSVTMLVLGLVVSLYWISVQRHTLMRKRAERGRVLYLAEAGVIDAMSRLRTGLVSRTIASPYTYCFNPNATVSPPPISSPCGAPSETNPVYVIISPINADGVNPIQATVNF